MDRATSARRVGVFDVAALVQPRAALQHAERSHRTYYGGFSERAAAEAYAAKQLASAITAGVRQGDLIFFKRSAWSVHQLIAERSRRVHPDANFGHVVMVMNVASRKLARDNRAVRHGKTVMVAHATVHGSLLAASLRQADSSRAGPMIEDLYDLLLEKMGERVITDWAVVRPSPQCYTQRDLANAARIAHALNRRGSFRMRTLIRSRYAPGGFEQAFERTRAPGTLDSLPPQTSFLCTGFIDYLLRLGRMWSRSRDGAAHQAFSYAYRLTPGHLLHALTSGRRLHAASPKHEQLVWRASAAYSRVSSRSEGWAREDARA